jgi:hypothetical protein
MSKLVVRNATVDDVTVLARLIDGFAERHPASQFNRSTDRLREAYFGTKAVGHIVIAEKEGNPIGFGIWRKAYDVFWSMFGGDGLGLYVKASHRGYGVALAIVAAMCEQIRREGGQFHQTSYDPDLAELYERIGIGRAERACHVSAAAFETLAALAGRTPREIVRALPDKALNFASSTT